MRMKKKRAFPKFQTFYNIKQYLLLFAKTCGENTKMKNFTDKSIPNGYHLQNERTIFLIE